MIGSEKVQQIIAGTRNFSAINNIANPEIIVYFEDLVSLLESQEQIFYDALGVSSIDELNQLLTASSDTNKLYLLNAGGAIYNQIKANYVFKGSAEEKSQPAIEENIFDLFIQLLKQNGISASSYLQEYLGRNGSEEMHIYDAFMDALTEAFQGITVDGGFIKYTFTARGSRSSTGRYAKSGEIGKATIKLNLNNAIKKGQIRIEDDMFTVTGDPTQFSSTVENEIRNVIRPELMKRLGREVQNKTYLGMMTEEEIRTLVNDMIISNGIYLSNADIQAARAIAINGSAGGISGYLGELQAHLLFTSIFQNVKNASIIDAGASYIKSLSGASQMDPTDLIIKIADRLFNIQIKNYASGGAEWGGSSKKIFGEQEVHDLSTATSFLTERLQLNSNILLNYFGALTYHNLNPVYENESSYYSYQNIYTTLKSIFEDLKPSFDTFLPNIIRLKMILEGGDTTFENFYFQKGKIITASSIVRNILNQLRNPNLIDRAFSAKYEVYPGMSHYTHQTPYVDNYVQYASETYIKWNVRVNFSKLL